MGSSSLGARRRLGQDAEKVLADVGLQHRNEVPKQSRAAIEQVAQLNARFGRPYCPQSHKYNHAVI